MLILNAFAVIIGLITTKGIKGGINKVRSMFVGSVMSYFVGGLCFVP